MGAMKRNTESKQGQVERGRWTSQRKTDVVLRLFRGASLDELSRELKVSTSRISEWRDAFLAGGQANLKSRMPDDRDDEIKRLQAKIGEQTMDLELLHARIKIGEGANHPQSRRSRP